MTRTIRRRAAVGVVGLTTALVALVGGLSTASGHPPVTGVVPTSFSAAGTPGATFTVNKVVHTPAIPPLVDICLVEDETGSFGDDIATLQTLAGAGGPLITALNATGANYASCVVGYRDFDQSTWGSTGDWVYRRLANVTPGGGGFVAGVPLLTAGGGNDGPEAQLEALHYLGTPGHAAIDSNGDSDTTDANDTAAGLQPSWRAGAKRVALLATDANCHVTGDAGGWPGDAGTTTAAVTAGILSAAGITVIGLTPGGAGTIACVDTLAAGTGGTVHATTASGSAIVAAIMAGLGNLPVTVTAVATCGPQLSISFAPPGPVTVTSGDDVAFTETISVSLSATPGSYGCTVDFLLDGNKVAGFTQTVTIQVVDRVPPTAGCVETNNPSGGNVPTSGPNAGKSGQNPDGFYVLNAKDNFDPNPMIFVGDSASTAVFGAFPSGTKIKLTQAPGVTPNQKPGAGDIDWKIQLKGDALVWAVDSAGNVSAAVSCKVPPPPK